MLVLWALALALPAAAQSLADLAHQEAERRKALRSQPAKVYGDEDLGRSGGASSTPSDVAPLATTPTPAEADATASQTVDEERAERAESEGVWRDRARPCTRRSHGRRLRRLWPRRNRRALGSA